MKLPLSRPRTSSSPSGYASVISAPSSPTRRGDRRLVVNDRLDRLPAGAAQDLRRTQHRRAQPPFPVPEGGRRSDRRPGPTPRRPARRAPATRRDGCAAPRVLKAANQEPPAGAAERADSLTRRPATNDERGGREPRGESAPLLAGRRGLRPPAEAPPSPPTFAFSRLECPRRRLAVPVRPIQHQPPEGDLGRPPSAQWDAGAARAARRQAEHPRGLRRSEPASDPPRGGHHYGLSQG